jgi:hypothetical protein
MRRGTIASLAALALLLLPHAVQAQTRRMFVGASIIADDDRTNSALTDSIAASWSLAAGFDLTPHFGVRLIFDAPREVGRRPREGDA